MTSKLNCLFLALIFGTLSPIVAAGSGFDEGQDAYRAGQFDKALRIFQEKAAEGYGEANSMLSLMYANGHGVKADPGKAREQALIAESRKSASAIAIVATLYFNGAFGRPDDAGGIEWLNKGVALRDINSMRMLATRLALGHGVAADGPRAFRLMQECALQERSPLCRADMGRMTEYGIASSVRLSSARTHYEAVRGYDGVAEYRLGRLYEMGIGVTPDFSRAMDFYMTAAKTYASGQAMNRLGMMYEKGRGVPVDLVQAAAWYEKAADFHDADGSVNGGRLFLEGKGVKRDPQEAGRWFMEAAEKSEPAGMRALAALYTSGLVAPATPGSADELLCKAAIIDQKRAARYFDHAVPARPARETAYRLATLRHCGPLSPDAATAARVLAAAVDADIDAQSATLQARWKASATPTLAMAQDMPQVDQ